MITFILPLVAFHLPAIETENTEKTLIQSNNIEVKVEKKIVEDFTKITNKEQN